jgi:hypothetical protein
MLLTAIRTMSEIRGSLDSVPHMYEATADDLQV